MISLVIWSFFFLPLHLLLSAQCHMITLSGRGSVNYWDDCDKFLPVDFRYCKRRCLNCDEPPWPLLPLPASRSSQTKRERQYTLRSDINLSFAPLMLPKHPIIPGESRLFCGLPEGLGGSLGSQLLDTSVFGLVKAWGFGGPCEGISSLCLHQMERPPSTPVLGILSGSLPLLWKGPVLTRRFSSNDDSQRQTFIFKTPPPHPSPPLLLLLIVCLHAMFCFCPSVPALLLSTQTHTLILVLMPASLPLRTPTHKLCPPPLPHPHRPRSPSATLLSNVAWWCHGQDQDALSSICHRGRPFILYYVVVMGPDRDLLNCWVRGTEGPRLGRVGGVGGGGNELVHSLWLQNWLDTKVLVV